MQLINIVQMEEHPVKQGKPINNLKTAVSKLNEEQSKRNAKGRTVRWIIIPIRWPRPMAAIKSALIDYEQSEYGIKP